MRTKKNQNLGLILLGITLGVAATLPISALARTNVPEKIEQMKSNVENSKVNLSEYEKNIGVVESNLKENEKAIKELAKMRESLKKQTSETGKGKQAIDANRKQLDGFLKAEQEKLAVENRQLEELKKTLERLEANREKRLANIAEYEEKLKAMDGEQSAWTERNESIVQLDKDLKEKESLAQADHTRLVQKKLTYNQEIEKWKKQVRVSERQYEGFKNLKD